MEKDPESGEFGVRCGRDDCRKFHPLEEINQIAAGFEEQKKKRKQKIKDEKIKNLRKIIREVIKSEEGVMELTMIG